MKIELIVTGKTVKSHLRDGVTLYADRIKRYLPFSYTELADIKNSASFSEKELTKRECLRVLEKLDTTDIVILLDENGKQFSSVDFAASIEKFGVIGTKKIVFVIGGAYGFTEELYGRANQQISLSKMTFSHQLVRVIFLEQLYRAMTIINNEPYHHA